MSAARLWLSLGGALAAGTGASLCCIGPVVLVSLGLGGATSAAVFEPYRPWLALTAVLLLGAGFLAAYRRERDERCENGVDCGALAHKRRMKVLVWVAAGLTLAALTFPYYVHLIA